MADQRESYQVAIDQYVYWRDAGLTDQQMLDALGYGRTDADRLGTLNVIAMIAQAWRGLQQRERFA